MRITIGGLLNNRWILKGDIMDELPQQTMKIKASRPPLVWVITIFYFVSFVFTAISFVLVYSGKIPVNPATKQYLASLTVFDHVITGAIAGCNLLAATLFFMLRRQSFHLFTTAFTITILSTVYQSIAKGWAQALGGSGVVGALIGYGIALSVIIYSFRLDKRGILK
jgi:hypothetical protein